MRKLTQSQQNAKLDSQKWEASLAFTRARGNWERALREHSLFSQEVLDARDHYMKMRKRVERLAEK